MNKSRVHRFRALGLLALPLIALAVVVIVIAWGHSTSQPTAAETTTATMALSVTNASKDLSDDCPPGKGLGDICLGLGSTFDLNVTIVTAPANGYSAFGTQIDYGANLTYKKTTSAGEEIKASWDGFPGITVRSQPTNQVKHGATNGTSSPFPSTTNVGLAVTVAMNCSTAKTQDNTVSLIPASAQNTTGSGFKDGTGALVPAKASDLTIHCINQPTATPSPTPPDIPPVVKLDASQANGGDADGDDPAGDSLSNLWLTRQGGSKIPPQTCMGGGDKDVFTEGILPAFGPIVTTDPKNPSEVQQLGAFEFEVHFDETKVCINLVAGSEWTGTSVVCRIEDDNSNLGAPAMEGVARIGCVTVGKAVDVDETLPLATIEVRPQPDVYSQAKPNQENGVVVQLNDVGCELADEQGHPIKIFSCEDADVTIRYLEGDVQPDCDVDSLDTQGIAFRWGAEKGTLLYLDRFNLEPSGTQADDDIDIKDLQFVYGRFGSTCKLPHPDQYPVNPKGQPPPNG